MTPTPQDLVFPDEDFRRTQPVAGPLRPFTLPPLQHFTLANGLEVYLVEQHALPLVSMDLSFDGGERLAPLDKAGLVGTCMSMLTEGTDQLDKQAFAEALGDVASTVAAYASEDFHGVTLSSLTRHLDRTFELFAATLRTPGFRQRDFDLLIRRRVDGVKQTQGIPQHIKLRAVLAVLYGRAHPIGAVPTDASLAAATLDDCKQFAATWLRPRGARLFVVGDQTELQIRARFEHGPLAGWSGAAGPLAPVPPPRLMPGRIFFVDVPGTAQSQLAVLGVGPGRTTPDFFATSLAGAVLAGGFASRVNMNLREDKGYAYGVRGGFAFARDYSVFGMHAGVQASATYQSLLEMHRELVELASGTAPPTADELDREKTGAILALPAGFATAQAALGQYRALLYYGLPLDYYNHYADGLASVSTTEVAAAARKHLPVDGAVYVVIGDGAAVQKVRDAGTRQDVAMTLGDSAVTLRDALAQLVATGQLGAGALVELDAEGSQKSPAVG